MRAALPVQLALPALESFLAENVEKEIRKDARVIRCAAVAVRTGVAPAQEAARQLLAAARETDRDFLERVGRFPVRIGIAYDELEPVRLRRIELGLDLAYRLLDAWSRGRKSRTILPRRDLALRVRELLELYSLEVLVLSRSVRLPAPLAALRERIAQRLRGEMAEIARSMTATLARP